MDRIYVFWLDCRRRACRRSPVKTKTSVHALNQFCRGLRGLIRVSARLASEAVVSSITNSVDVCSRCRFIVNADGNVRGDFLKIWC